MKQKVSEAFQKALKYIFENKQEWLLGNDKIRLETTNHVLRIIIQENLTADYVFLLDKLCALQHDDGGWGDYNDSPPSQPRVTAFATQMLFRANLSLKNEKIHDHIKRGLDYLLKNQQTDGSWIDPKWHVYDATSVPTGTLIFIRQQPWYKPEYAAALEKGLNFIISSQQENGLWETQSEKASSIEATAHLLQKCISAGVAPEKVNKAITGLLSVQHQNGYWEGENVDATCDVTRCLIYALSMQVDYPQPEAMSLAIESAMNWLLNISENAEYGYTPDMKPNVLVTCDFTDTAYKYLLYCNTPSAMPALYR